jgi:hypothetical protein
MVAPFRYSQELTIGGGANLTREQMYSMAMKILVSTIAVALGAFIAASPHRAAQIWGSQRLATLSPEHRPPFIRLLRAFGILLCLAGVLLAIDTILLSNYPH